MSGSPELLLVLLVLLLLLQCHAGVIHPPAPSPVPPTSQRSGLDPKQLTALQSMNLPTSKDPCTLPPPHNFTTCDSSAPFRHLLSLTLTNCSADLDLSTTALRSLSTLRSLSFLHCPIPAVHIPAQLSSSLRSFTCVASLRRLTGVWLSHFPNLTDLTVTDVPINASGPAIVLSQMRWLRSLTISRTNLTGFLPRHYWHSLNLTHIDLSSNRLRGPVPPSIGRLESLAYLNLSSNSLSGELPDTIGNLGLLQNASFSYNSMSGPIPESVSEMSALTHLDLSSNQFNGSIPRFLSEMNGLKYLNLENNNFQGVIPFNESFIKKLQVFKVGGNSNLCYNHSILSSKLKLGIAPCDRYGIPVSPPPARSAPVDSSSDYSDDGGDVKAKGGGGSHHGPSTVVLGVAIGLSCLIFLIIFCVCLSKVCK